jgi:CBS domain-containing protein
MKANQLMEKSLCVVTPGDRLSKAAGLMRDRSVGLIPVVDDPKTMHLEGVITDRDIAVRCVGSDHDGMCRVSDHMTANHLVTARPDATAEDVIELMENAQVRRIPVVGDGQLLEGIIAQADLATKYGPENPRRLEQMLERISQPRTQVLAAPRGAEVNHEIQFTAAT